MDYNSTAGEPEADEEGKHRPRDTDWDDRYRKGFYDGADGPHGLLVQYHDLFTGRTADIAMGNGRTPSSWPRRVFP
jgi:hypothetical protein